MDRHTLKVYSYPASSDCGGGVGPFSEYTPKLETPLVPMLAERAPGQAATTVAPPVAPVRSP